jgi:hypothetical protein
VWWPQLKKELETIPESKAEGKEVKPEGKPASGGPKDQAILEELLELVRNQTKLLRSPSSLLPPGYLAEALGEMKSPVHALRRRDADTSEALRYLRNKVAEMREVVDKLAKKDLASTREDVTKAALALEAIENVTRHALSRPFLRAVGRG